jgi:hypothetical protein
MTPATAKWTTAEKNARSNPRAIMNGKPLNIINSTYYFLIHGTLFPLQFIANSKRFTKKTFVIKNSIAVKPFKQ